MGKVVCLVIKKIVRNLSLFSEYPYSFHSTTLLGEKIDSNYFLLITPFRVVFPRDGLADEKA